MSKSTLSCFEPCQFGMKTPMERERASHQQRALLLTTCLMLSMSTTTASDCFLKLVMRIQKWWTAVVRLCIQHGTIL